MRYKGHRSVTDAVEISSSVLSLNDLGRLRHKHPSTLNPNPLPRSSPLGTLGIIIETFSTFYPRRFCH